MTRVGTRSVAPDPPTDRFRYWFRHTKALWPAANRLLSWRIRRAQGRLIHRLGNPLQKIEARGVTVPIDLRDTSDFLFFTNSGHEQDFERDLMEIASRIVRPGDVCLDIGANRGFLTLLLSFLSGPTGRVHAVEPSLGALVKFRRTSVANERTRDERAEIVLHTIAAWDISCSLPFYSSSIDPARDSTQSHGTGTTTEVEARPLDEILENEGIVRFIKMDIEGAELRALRGMRALLDRSPDLMMVIEWNPVYSTRGLWTELTQRFHVSKITPSGPVGVSDPRRIRGVQNLLCRPA